MRLRIAGEGPLVIKVAGLAGGVGLYREAVDAVRAAGFRVGELDTTGDRADDPAGAPISYDSLAAEVLEAIDRSAAPRAILWGTSFGALVCLAAAARGGDRVSGLLLCSPPPPDWRPATYLRILRWASRQQRPERISSRAFQVSFLLMTGWEFLSPVALRRLPSLVRASRDAATPHSTVYSKLRLLFEDRPAIPDPCPPAAIVTGAWDPVTPRTCSDRLAALLPGSRLQMLRFVGHSCAYARPHAYARHLVEALRRLSVGR
jgi:pimeloyl-ACP methyl ester carboxylesterase